MNEVVVSWCRGQKLEVARSRAYKKNDQAFVEQKNGSGESRAKWALRKSFAETNCVAGHIGLEL